jgi:tryptophanyl-tRNA synthetase
MTKKIVLSGIQPTGAPHIGNYFGMMKQVVDSQNEFEVYGMVVNYHALTTINKYLGTTRDVKVKKNIRDIKFIARRGRSYPKL